MAFGTPPRTRLQVSLQSTTVHLVTVPLLLLGLLSLGVLLLWCKEVLLPFVVSFFLVYLLRPLINLLTQPFSRLLLCGACPSPSPAPTAESPPHTVSRPRRRETPPKYPRTARGAIATLGAFVHGLFAGQPPAAARAAAAAARAAADESALELLPTSASSSTTVTAGSAPSPLLGAGAVADALMPPAGGSKAAASGPSASSSTAAAAAATGDGGNGNGSSGVGGGGGPAPSSENGDVSSAEASLGGGEVTAAAGISSGGGGVGRGRTRRLPVRLLAPAPPGYDPESCGLCCGPLRFTRCPRWFATITALAIAIALCSGAVLLIYDAVQRFQQESLNEFLAEGGRALQVVQRWLALVGIKLQVDGVLDFIKTNLGIVNTVQTALTLVAASVGNLLLILLLVLYLLAEQAVSSGGGDTTSLRAKADAQIERYLTIKTAISAAQGAIIWGILGPGLGVRLAFVWGLAHFLLNYIPTAGPILATALPLPIILLDPRLGFTSKIAAFVAPTIVHLLVGSVLEPILFGSSMELHPITVLMALAVWYSLWGVPGAILAVPITAVLRIIVSSSSHPYARAALSLLEGRFAATTAELDEDDPASDDGMADVERGSKSSGTEASPARRI